MPASIRAHLATTPDSTYLESLAVLADRAVASETDVKDNSVGVAEVRVNDSERLIGIMADISRRLKKLETSGNKKNNSTINSKQTQEVTERQTSKHFSPMQMRDPLHLALLKIKTVMKILDKMFSQTHQPLARPLRRRTHCKPVPHSQWPRTMHWRAE